MYKKLFDNFAVIDNNNDLIINDKLPRNFQFLANRRTSVLLLFCFQQRGKVYMREPARTKFRKVVGMRLTSKCNEYRLWNLY